MWKNIGQLTEERDRERDTLGDRATAFIPAQNVLTNVF